MLGTNRGIDKSNFNAFTTKGGRTVYDGGGVLPDVIVEETKKSAVTDALVKNDAVFDYATTLYYKNPNLTGIPSISETDFTTFKTFIKQEKYSLDSETGKALKELLEKAKKENIDGAITTEYKAMQLALEKSQDVEVTKNKEDFKKLLQEELITRYQYKEGLYEYYTQKDIEITKAKAVLNDLNQYRGILKQ